MVTVYSLKDFHRPPEDNALGIAYGPGLHQLVEPWTSRLRYMHMKWITTLRIENDIIDACAANGIQPVMRPFLRANEDWNDFGEVAERMLARGLGPYVQAYNEPELQVEWPGGVVDRWSWYWRWIFAAENIIHHGGYPGIQLLDPDWLRELLQLIKQQGKQYIFEQMWLSAHNYTSNHPPSYPYDSLNKVRLPDGSYRQATIYDDWFGWLHPLKLMRVIEEEVGHAAPCICTEGGWCIGDSADARYPNLSVRDGGQGYELHRDYHAQAMDQFRTGVLPNGEPLPDWWFAVTPWLMASQLLGGPIEFEENAWYSENLSGTKQLTIDAIGALPVFTRKFSWDAEPLPAPEPAPVPQPEPTPAPVVEVRWRVFDANGVQIGAYYDANNAAKQAHGHRGYARWIVDDGHHGIMDFRDPAPEPTPTPEPEVPDVTKPEFLNAFLAYKLDNPDIDVGEPVSDQIDVYPADKLSIQVTTKGLFVYQYGVVVYLPGASPHS